ncbi:MAG: hypothetical protein KKF44_02710 [Nanoarchaeota archaeon]|nr:hypothetical protein [Nanoarchaeota archaeon]
MNDDSLSDIVGDKTPGSDYKTNKDKKESMLKKLMIEDDYQRLLTI